MRTRCVPCGSLSGQIGGHGAWAARGKTHVVHHADPFSIGVLRFHVRRHGLDAGLGRGIHAGGGEVFDFAVHQQPERAAVIGLAEIQFQRVHLREALERLGLEVAEITMRPQVRQHIVVVLVPGAGRRTCVATDHNFERRIRRSSTGEILVGENVILRRMIHRQQLHLIEIDDFLQRLHEAEAELAVFLRTAVAVDP